MLRTLISLAVALCLTACNIDVGKQLSTKYELLFSRAENLLRHSTIRGSTLELRLDGSYVQECVAADGTRTQAFGRWSQEGGWITFSEFLDCAGAWPPRESNSGATLRFSLKPTPEIVVEPDLNVLYVALSSPGS